MGDVVVVIYSLLFMYMFAYGCMQLAIHSRTEKEHKVYMIVLIVSLIIFGIVMVVYMSNRLKM